MSSKIRFNSRVWLNGPKSHYTGNMVCFDGDDVINQGKLLPRYTFVEIGSCHGKMRVHRDDNLPMSDFIAKLRLMQYELSVFADHLEGQEEADKFAEGSAKSNEQLWEDGE